MFEFDEHFAELEAMQTELESSEPQADMMLPNWVYLGNGVWTLNFEAAATQPTPEWLLSAADVT